MSRLDYLTIAIVAVCILALIFLVYRYVNLPHGAENVQPTTEVIEKDTTTSLSKDLNGFPAEDSSENVQPGPGAVVEPSQTPKENTPAKTEPVKTEPVKPNPAPVQPVTPPVDNTISESASAASGRYMVIAGSFEQMSHAQKQLRKVQKLGYSNARVEKFNKGAYASVLVDRFDKASQAKALANTLKSKGLDAMVLVKK